MKQSTINTTNISWPDAISALTSCGGEEVPAGTFHGGEEVPAGTFHEGGVVRCSRCKHWIAASRIRLHLRTCGK